MGNKSCEKLRREMKTFEEIKVNDDGASCGGNQIFHVLGPAHTYHCRWAISVNYVGSIENRIN